MAIPSRRLLPSACVLALGAAVAVSGCSGSGSQTAPPAKFPHDAPTLLAAGTGNLEGSPSMRLTMKVSVPEGGGRPSHGVDMTGIWDLRQRSGRMEGRLRDARTTVLSVSGTEYVSLPAALRKQTGKEWLRATPGNETFAKFPDPHRIAMILRTAQAPKLAAQGDANGRPWHVQGEVDRDAALKKIPDPTLKDFVVQWPAKSKFDLFTDDAGKPVKIVLKLPKEKKKYAGTVTLSDFGAMTTVQAPNAETVLTRLPGPKSQN
jgi:hypothetical protein